VVKRVLRKDGTLWLNLGDSYATSSSHGSGYGEISKTAGVGNAQKGVQARAGCPPNLKPKDLCGIPWRVALALQADGWWLRLDIIWAKPNPMPEAHEYVFLLTKSAKYFYDADAVREDGATPINSKAGHAFGGRKNDTECLAKSNKPGKKWDWTATRNLRSVWTIPTEPTPEAHFATFPEKLVIPCIKAGTSEKGCCPECGAPWVRVVEKVKDTRTRLRTGLGQDSKEGTQGRAGETQFKTIGWNPGCSCLKHGSYTDRKQVLHVPIPCTVLDPFSGSGKTLIVAKKFGRKAIGIELNPEYCKMPLKKISQDRLF